MWRNSKGRMIYFRVLYINMTTTTSKKVIQLSRSLILVILYLVNSKLLTCVIVDVRNISLVTVKVRRTFIPYAFWIINGRPEYQLFSLLRAHTAYSIGNTFGSLWLVDMISYALIQITDIRLVPIEFVEIEMIWTSTSYCVRLDKCIHNTDVWSS